MASVFSPEYKVPENLVAETPALRKKTCRISGTAGIKRKKLIKAIANEKKQSTNKLGYMDPPLDPRPASPRQEPEAPPPTRQESTRPASPLPPRPQFVLPSPRLASDDEAEVLFDIHSQ